MEIKTIFLILFLSAISIFIVSQHFNISLTGMLSGTPTGYTTTNVTVKGTIGAISVLNFPVNFTTRPPGTACQPKAQGGSVGYINVTLNSSNNVNYNVYINGSNLVSSDGASIPVSKIAFNDTDSDTTGCYFGTALSSSPVTETGLTNRPFNQNTTIYFWINTTTGIANNTYTGNLTIFVNSTNGDAENNETWTGLGNLTVIIDKNIEVQWSFVPINFTSLSPGSKANATANQGNPANFSIGANSNIYVDAYINGTDLTCVGGACGTNYIFKGNLTYTNTSYYNGTFRQLSLSWQNFYNWNNTPNNTNLLSYWNISIPSGQSPGNYGGNITGKSVETGTSP
jgi:hypothetical protein